MNREIKFRGYDEENKCWRYGWYTKLAEGIRRFDAIISDVDGELTRFYIHDSKTITQFTGLLDKNGKEIYEGDIISFSERQGVYCNGIADESRIVKWDEGEAGFKFFYLTIDKRQDCGFCFAESTSKIMEIIGNIYENKELLG